MQTYIILANLTDQGVNLIKNAPQRIQQSATDIKAMGGNLIGFYTTMGEYDYIAIFEAPSDEVMMTFLLKTGMAGSVRTKTLKAFTRENLASIINKLQ
jgi:uncharacterized protein with GYD domain